MPTLGYTVRLVDHQIIRDGSRYAATLNHEAREIQVSSIVPVIDQLRACVILGARLESMRHPEAIPVLPMPMEHPRVQGREA